MSNRNNSSAGAGIGFTGLLTIVFIALRLANIIDWSWWWVLSPLWISFSVCILVLVIVFGIAIIRDRYEEKRRKRNNA